MGFKKSIEINPWIWTSTLSPSVGIFHWYNFGNYIKWVQSSLTMKGLIIKNGSGQIFYIWASVSKSLVRADLLWRAKSNGKNQVAKFELVSFQKAKNDSYLSTMFLDLHLFPQVLFLYRLYHSSNQLFTCLILENLLWDGCSISVPVTKLRKKAAFIFWREQKNSQEKWREWQAFISTFHYSQNNGSSEGCRERESVEGDRDPTHTVCSDQKNTFLACSIVFQKCILL